MFDQIIILSYLSVILGIGFYISRFEGDENDYFLAGRRMRWMTIGASLFAASVSGEHFIGLFDLGAIYGFQFGHIELISCFMLLILCYFVLPIYLRAGISTVPEYLEKRFSKPSRIYLNVISMFTYIVTKISVTLFVSGFLLHKILGWDISKSAIIIIIVSGMYAILGGFKTIIKIDVIQSAVLISGMVLLMIFSVKAIGGFNALQSAVPGEYLCIWSRQRLDDLPLAGLIVAIPIIGFWYWCTDQFIVQRALSGKTVQDAQRGTILAGFFRVLPIFFFLLPGMISHVVLRPANGNGSFIFATLVMSQIIPTGVKGLVVAGLLAALMSSLANALNACSALFTLDLYKQLKPGARGSELVLVGRLITTALVILGIIWIPFMRNMQSNIYLQIIKVNALLSPSVAAVFIMGMLWRRMNAKGAFWTLLLGGGLSFYRLLFEFSPQAMSVSVPVLDKLLTVHYLYYTIVMFVCSGIFFVAISMLTESKGEAVSDHLVLTRSWERYSKLKSIGQIVSTDFRCLNTKISIALVIIIVFIYVVF